MKEAEQKILHQFGWLSIISADQATHITAHKVQQWAERYHPQSNCFNRELERATESFAINDGRRQRHEGLAYMPL